MIPTREEAWQIVTEFTASESLRRHMLAVEFAMRAYAKKFEGDADLWGVVGLLHDFDYERYPDVAANGHPMKGAEILRDRGVDEVVIAGILSHAPEISGRQPLSPMEKALSAVDELTGFIVAVTLVRPSKKIEEVALKSIKKKWKDKAFAAPVDRSAIEQAAAELGLPLDEHLQLVLDAMKSRAGELGL